MIQFEDIKIGFGFCLFIIGLVFLGLGLVAIMIKPYDGIKMLLFGGIIFTISWLIPYWPQRKIPLQNGNEELK